jgi:hypothetical protein
VANDIPTFDDWVKTRTPRERVLGVARSEQIPDDIAEDYLKVTKIESGHNVNVRSSSKGARGFGQVMPDKPGGNTRTVGGRQYDLRDPDQNITAGLRYFSEGGADPVARRLHYFGGPKARQKYERTGKIPNISDGNMTAAQYVRATGGQKQPPKFDEWNPDSDVPKFDDWAKDSGQNLPPSDLMSETQTPAGTPMSPAKAPSVPMSPFERAAARLSRPQRQRVETSKRVAPATGRAATLFQQLGQQRTIEQVQREQEQAARAEAKAELQSERGPAGSPTLRGIARLISSPTEKFGEIFKSDEQIINERAAEKVKQQQILAEPEVTEIRKEYGRMPAAVRSVAAPVIGRGGGGFLKTAGGLASVFGIAPNRLSEWANKRAEIIEAGSTAVPLAEERGLSSLINGEPQLKEIERGIPEKIATGVADLGVGLASIIALKRATKLSFPQLLALEAAAKNSEKPATEQAAKAAEGFALGTALESHLGRTANAALFGIPTAAQAGYEVAQGRMSPVDALIQTGIQAGAGAILTPGKRGRRERQVETQPDVTARPEAVESGQGQPDVPVSTPVTTESAPQRFYHKDWGEVEVLQDQSGARPGRVKVAEVADPTKQHFPKRSDLAGRGNQRMVPVKAEEIATDLNLESGLEKPSVLDQELQKTSVIQKGQKGQLSQAAQRIRGHPLSRNQRQRRARYASDIATHDQRCGCVPVKHARPRAWSRRE